MTVASVIPATGKAMGDERHIRFNDGTICTIEVFICASTGGAQRTRRPMKHKDRIICWYRVGCWY